MAASLLFGSSTLVCADGVAASARRSGWMRCNNAEMRRGFPCTEKAGLQIVAVAGAPPNASAQSQHPEMSGEPKKELSQRPRGTNLGVTRRLLPFVRLCRFARAYGATASQVALAWMLKRSPLMLPIPGTSKVMHLEENVAGVALQLSDEDFNELNGAASGHS